MTPLVIHMPPGYDHDIVCWDNGEKKSGSGFIGKAVRNDLPTGWINLEICPVCGRENYAMNVTSGICTWCGFDANKEKKI